jgi:hypothetical protein
MNDVSKNVCRPWNSHQNQWSTQKLKTFLQKCVMKNAFPISEGDTTVTKRRASNWARRQSLQYGYYDTAAASVRCSCLQLQVRTLYVWKKYLYTSKHVSLQTAVFQQHDYSTRVCSIFASRMSYCGRLSGGQRSGSTRDNDAITACGPDDSIQLLAAGQSDFFHIRHWPISRNDSLTTNWRSTSVHCHGLRNVYFFKGWLHTYF